VGEIALPLGQSFPSNEAWGKQATNPTPRIASCHFQGGTMGTWNPARLSPIIFTAVVAIIVCALLAGLTDIGWFANVVIGVVILAIGLLGVWMLDKRRPAAT
jgi:hypothetical protein